MSYYLLVYPRPFIFSGEKIIKSLTRTVGRKIRQDDRENQIKSKKERVKKERVKFLITPGYWDDGKRACQSLVKKFEEIIPGKLYLGNRQGGFKAYEDIILKNNVQELESKENIKFDAVVSILNGKDNVNEYSVILLNKNPNPAMPKKDLFSKLSEQKDAFHYVALGDTKIKAGKVTGKDENENKDENKNKKELFFKKLNNAVDFIQQCVENNKRVLVHCDAGCSLGYKN